MGRSKMARPLGVPLRTYFDLLFGTIRVGFAAGRNTTITEILVSESSDPRKFFEEFLEHPTLDLDFADEFLLRRGVAVWNVNWEGTNARDDAYVTFKNVSSTGNRLTSCQKASVFDIGGTSYTDAAGTGEFFLSDFYCHEWLDFGHGRLAFEYPVVFLATPQTNVPVFLTSVQELFTHDPPIRGPANDVKVTVFSWDVNGDPHGDILFDWRCSIPMSWDSIFD